MNFRQFIGSDRMRLGLLFVFVLLTRIPFLDAGYGEHVDAWRIANTAQHIAQTHDYVVSRFPGYPVQEIACAFIWKGGPIALNAASALFGAVAVLMFALIMREMGSRDYLIGGLALAFAPVIYVNSVTSKDFMWALAFMLGSFYAILKNRPFTAGICLGLAIGSRITSGALALPLCLVLYGLNEKDGRWFRKTAVFAASSAMTALITFLPVIMKYGTGFFDFYEQEYPKWDAIQQRATTELWGTFGVIGIIAMLVLIAWRSLSKSSSPPPFTRPWFDTTAWAGVIVIYFIVFLRLPHHASYLIPVMPFALLLFARFTPRAGFIVLCVLIMAGSFVSLDGNGFSAGAIFKDRRERAAITARINGFLAFTSHIPGKGVFVVGGWEPEITNISPLSAHPDRRYVYTITAREVKQCTQTGETLYYASPLIQQFNKRVTGIDLARYGAKNVRAIFEERMRSQTPAK